MTVDVCIPWRPQPQRMEPYYRVLSFWQHHGFDPIIADSDPAQPFSLSQARNNAVRKSKADIIIVADADTIPDIGAVVASYDNPGVTWPFTTYRHIDPAWVHRHDLFTAPVVREYKGSVGGLLVCPRKVYWELGGMDEKFHPTWGFEDNAFFLVTEALSTVHRQPGFVFSFDHTVDNGRDLSPANPNRARYQLYRHAARNPDMMRELIR
jgi:hypothetical protein